MDDEGSEHVEEPQDALKLEPTATVRSRRPRALWGVLALIAVVAGALVITSADDEGNQVPGLPVDLTGAARSAGGDEEAAADAMFAFVEYVPGDDLPALGGEATAYRLSGDVDQAEVRELADALGLEGEVASDDNGAWWVDGGGTGRLDVYTGSGASWGFFAGERDCLDADGSISACCPPNAACKTFSTTGTAIADAGATGGGSAGCDNNSGCDAPTTTACVPVDPSGVPAPDECVETAPDGGECGANDGPAECITGVDEDATSTDCDDVVTETVPPEASGDEPVASPPSAACPEPRPAVDPDTEDEARRAALSVVEASGFDVTDARVDATAGISEAGGSWYVTVEPVLDGVPSGITSYIEVTTDGRVLSGNGMFGPAEELGDYPLLDTRAAIARANEQSASYSGREPALGAPGTSSSTTGGTDTGSVDDVEATPDDSTVATAVDPCVPPEGAADGCGTGGTTDCGDDGCVPTTTVPCKVQPDGREICEYDDCRRLEETGTEGTTTGGDDVAVAVPHEDPATGATEPGSAGDDPVAPPEAPDCSPPPDPGTEPEPVPEPEPQPIEIVLVDAEPSLVALRANDGSGDAYLVPAYRFTAEDDSTVDLPAVTDEVLRGSNGTDTTVPDTAPEPEPVPEPQPCAVPEETDAGSVTTFACPTPGEDGASHVEAFVMDDHCTWLVVKLDGKVWWTPGYYTKDLYGWTQPTEAGTFTINPDGTGEFVADADPARTATLEPWTQDAVGPLCE